MLKQTAGLQYKQTPPFSVPTSPLQAWWVKKEQMLKSEASQGQADGVNG